MPSCGPWPQASYHSDLPPTERLEVKHSFGRGPRRAARSRSGDTPLHSAAYGGHAETVAALLAAGADKARQRRSGDLGARMRGAGMAGCAQWGSAAGAGLEKGNGRELRSTQGIVLNHD